jgi:hypothetical protein
MVVLIKKFNQVGNSLLVIKTLALLVNLKALEVLVIVSLKVFSDCSLGDYGISIRLEKKNEVQVGDSLISQHFHHTFDK